ncbi:hypothetical protein CVULP_0865 [Campylobacter vulpis]|uniref:hypothetical protein n=2 Tax=Campylobacter vulpis TaxID=1655500 RepID=UPI001BCEB43D|nr:hypothetical protein [Campylobacter vulpis]MBS4235323.1 hypothetical protein [Campylobacter vulpis]MBS4268660.1 hypothetical protein [Campylobacter vulpis]MBS4275633.1 hypothetical protein [Campylobacter vulpis]MBS4306843.1 hypothetical protein [Campylobacter vulpis]MBS4313161.1 hypothetical protein [Campylobacter vulpis]
MQISNLSELLNAKVLNEGSMLSVGGFALNLQSLKPSYAFFSNDEEELKEAVKRGAFVVVSERQIIVEDKDVFYLLCEDLQKALLRLLRFLSEEKNLQFIFCDKIELEIAKIFGIQQLNANVFLDFDLIKNAKNNTFFCLDDTTYLLKLCAKYKTLCDDFFELQKNSSLFFSTFIYKGNLYKNLSLAPFYVKFFVKWLNFLENNMQKLTFDLKKFECYEIYFVNENYEITEFGKARKAFIVVFNEENFNFWKEKTKDIKGFKNALCNSLFCDYSYSKLEDLKQFKDFTYCLILLQNTQEFLELFNKKKEEENKLF